MQQQRLFKPLAMNYRTPRSFNAFENVFDISTARHELSWRPQVTFEFALGRMIQAAQAKLVARA